MAEWRKLTELLRLEERFIPAYSVSVEREYLQRVWCSRRDAHTMHYHTSLFPSSYDLKDAVVLAHKASLAVAKIFAPDLTEKEADYDVGRTAGTNKEEKSDKEEKENDRYAAGITHCSEIID